MKRFLFALLLLVFPSVVMAQQAVVQGGTWTTGHVPKYNQTGGTQPLVTDGGGAGGGAAGVNLSTLGITARGTGTAPYDGQGAGPNGENLCMYDAPTTNSTGYHWVCLDPNVGANALISTGVGGTGSAQGLDITVNGTTALSISSAGVVSGFISDTLTDTHILVGNGSNVATDVALSGDATMANTGAIDVNTIGGVAPGDLYPLDYDANFTNDTGSLALSDIAAGSLIANSTAGAAEPTGTTLTAVLDQAVSSTQGSIIYRNATTWVALGPGSSGTFLKSQGAGANLTWGTPLVATLGDVRVVTSGASDTVLGTDFMLVVNKTIGGATTIYLPAIPAGNFICVVKDGKGDAASNNITVDGNGNNMDGASTIVMNLNYQSLNFAWNGTQWNVW
jgi:hypothetical protein